MVDDRDETDIRYRFHRPALGKDGVVARLPADSHQAPGNKEQMEECKSIANGRILVPTLSFSRRASRYVTADDHEQ